MCRCTLVSSLAQGPTVVHGPRVPLCGMGHQAGWGRIHTYLKGIPTQKKNHLQDLCDSDTNSIQLQLNRYHKLGVSGSEKTAQGKFLVELSFCRKDKDTGEYKSPPDARLSRGKGFGATTSLG